MTTSSIIEPQTIRKESYKKSVLSNKIYNKYRIIRDFVRDTEIFISVATNVIADEALAFRVSKNDSAKKYIHNRNTDQIISRALYRQASQGIYENSIVNIISRTEAFIVDYITIAIFLHPEKIAILIDDKSGIPIDLFLAKSTKEEVLNELIRSKAESITYLPPKKYVEKFEKILSVKLNKSYVSNFIEAKASRDIIVHGSGTINATYLSKSEDKSREHLGDKLKIDEEYFKSVADNSRNSTLEIYNETRKKYI